MNIMRNINVERITSCDNCLVFMQECHCKNNVNGCYMYRHHKGWINSGNDMSFDRYYSFLDRVDRNDGCRKRQLCFVHVFSTYVAYRQIETSYNCQVQLLSLYFIKLTLPFLARNFLFEQVFWYLKSIIV